MDILTPVKQFTPTFLNIDNSSLLTSHANMIKAVDQNNTKATELYKDLNMTLASMDFNPDEAEYVQEKYNQIKNTLENGSSFLGSGTAYNALIKAQGDIFGDKVFIGKLNNQKLYKEEQSRIDNMKNASEDYKEYMKEHTTYTKKDDNGNVIDLIIRDENDNSIGVQTWKPDRKYTDPIDNIEILKYAKQYTHDDKITTILNEMITIGDSPTLSQSIQSNQHLDVDKLYKSIMTAVNNYPNALNSLKQQQSYELARYNEDPIKYAEFKRANNNFENYLKSLFMKGVEAMSYSYKDSNTKNTKGKDDNSGGGLGSPSLDHTPQSVEVVGTSQGQVGGNYTGGDLLTPGAWGVL